MVTKKARSIPYRPRRATPKCLDGIMMKVTPAIALAWLESNTRNRDIKFDVVKRYVRDIKAGKWGATHQGICFDTDGLLVDGQHRLWAIIEADTAVMMQVTFNLDPNTRGKVDGPVVRTHTDVWRLLGEFNGIHHQAQSILRSMLRGVYPSMAALTNDEATVEMKRHFDAVAFASSCFPHSKARLTSCRVKGLLARAYYQKDKNVNALDNIKSFAEVLVTGKAPSGRKYSTVLRLREMLLTGESGGRPMSMQRTYLLTQHALVAFMKGKGLSVLRCVKDEDLFDIPGNPEKWRKVSGRTAPGRRLATLLHAASELKGDTFKSSQLSPKVKGMTTSLVSAHLCQAEQRGLVECVSKPEGLCGSKTYRLVKR